MNKKFVQEGVEKMNRKKYTFIFVIVFTFVLAACSSNNMDNNDGNQSTDNQQNTQENQGNQENQDNQGNQTENGSENTSNTDVKVTPTDAYEQYVKEFPDTKVKKVHLDQNNGSYVYEIEGFDDTKEYKMKINSMNGEVIESKSELDADVNKEIPKEPLNNVLTIVDEALQDAGQDAILDGWEVDYDNGVLVLEVEIDLANGDDVDYKYNLETDEWIKKDS